MFGIMHSSRRRNNGPYIPLPNEGRKILVWWLLGAAPMLIGIPFSNYIEVYSKLHPAINLFFILYIVFVWLGGGGLYFANEERKARIKYYADKENEKNR